jgi:hypothetical protein
MLPPVEKANFFGGTHIKKKPRPYQISFLLFQSKKEEHLNM